MVYGTSTGLRGWGHELWRDPGLAQEAQFGRALTAGDFDGDTEDDLVVGIPFREIEGQAFAGAFEILYGAASGLIRRGIDDYWHQGRVGIESDPMYYELFAHSLAAGDFDGDGRSDLAVGVPREDVGGVSAAGALHILYGGPIGISAVGSQFWHQDSPDVQNLAEADDLFAFSLASVPPRTAQPIFADDLETGDLGRWSAIVPGS